MKLLKEEVFNQKIKDKFDYEFQIFQEGFYIIEIKARAKSWLQNTLKLISFFKDDDLALKIDGLEFPKLNKRRGLFDSEAAWNGNYLRGFQQINIFFIYLEKGNHLIGFLADQIPFLETIKIYQAQNEKEIIFEPSKNYQIEDGNRRPWLKFILNDLALQKLFVKAKANRRSSDDDDLQIRINGRRQINETPKSHKYWYWCGQILKGQTKVFEKELNLAQGLHYIEFWADKIPGLHRIHFKLGEIADKDNIGQIAIYDDIVTGIDEINLRSEPNERSIVLLMIPDRERIVILEKAIQGSRPAGLLSDLWHQILYKGRKGFVHSSFIEIKGQEREKIIEKIKIKAKGLNLDENLVLNLAHCESKWLPFAHSLTNNKGIYQLGEDTIKEINEKHGGNIIDPYNIEQNIDGGLKYFQYLLNKYKGSSNHLQRVITVWNRGLIKISYQEPFIFKNQPEETQQLIRCVLEEKRGKKYLKILGLFLFLFLIGFSIFSFIATKREKADYVNYLKKERSVYLSQDYVASFLEQARKEEVALVDFEDDFDGDGIFEKVKFGFFSPEPFYYLTKVYSPNNKVVDIFGLFSKAETRDLNNDGIKELILTVINGRMFNFFVLVYEQSGLRLLPTYNQSLDYYDGIWAGLPIEFQDIDNDGTEEILAKTEDFPSGNWRDWYNLIEYYKWNGTGFERYQKEKKGFDDPCRNKLYPCAGG